MRLSSWIVQSIAPTEHLLLPACPLSSRGYRNDVVRLAVV